LTTNDISRYQGDLVWGRANPVRGLVRTAGSPTAYIEHAVALVREYPVGSVLSAQQFDYWLQGRELLVVPADGISKDSDAWLGHLQRRHQRRAKINKAATHPRMFEEYQSHAFMVGAVGGGFEIRSPHAAASNSDLVRKVSSLTITKRRQIAHLMQSTDWLSLPPHEQAVAEVIYDDIVALEEDTSTSADRITSKLERLEHRIQLALNSGDLKPTDGGGFQLLLGNEGTEDDAQDDVG
jgi:hypothetical protein